MLLLQACVFNASISDLQSKSSSSENNSIGDGGGAPTTPTVPESSNYPSIASGVWLWLKGSSTSNSAGSFGTLGIESDNATPGAKSYMYGNWSDSSGNIWLMGGHGYDSTNTLGGMNDLWKFNVNSGKWMWVAGSNLTSGLGNWGTQGVSSATNYPSPRRSFTCATDLNGNLWLYGGYGKDEAGASGFLGDLWKFNTTTKEWVWVAGRKIVNEIASYGAVGVENSSIAPGGRRALALWVDYNGNVWLFGGKVAGADPSYGWQSDLWRWNKTTNMWTYFGGSGVSLGTTKRGNYGTKGVANATNWPGARHSFANATSNNAHNLYLFGGEGTDSVGGEWTLNDLWSFNVDTLQWTWRSGSQLIATPGVYGTQKVAAAGNYPGGRTDLGMTIDKNDNIWIFGGYGSPSTATDAGLDDLWKYDITSGYWTWMSGSSAGNATGSWGTKGVVSTSNSPGARGGIQLNADPKGGIWLFGGDSFTSSPVGLLNDLWFFQP